MAEEAPKTNPDSPPEGVFGNLPGTRPGSRSPRRDSAGGEPPAKPAPKREHSSSPPPPPPPADPEPPPATEREAPVTAESPAGQRITSVEDLAWAGVAVAANAATVGVRFASRALDAARKSVERD